MPVDAQPAEMPAPPVHAIVRPPVDAVTRLNQIVDLHAQGILTDEEFAVAKSQLHS